MNTPLDPQRVDQLIADYVDGTIGEADLAAFCAWVEQSPANARLVASYSAIEYGMTEVCRDNTATDLMSTLQEIEAGSGDVGPVDITAQMLERERLQRAGQSAAGPADADRGPRVLIIPRAVAWSGLAAAVLLVGLVIYNLAARGPTVIAPPITDNIQEPLAPVEVAQATVARIVRTVDPVWENAQHGSDVPRSNDHQLQPGIMHLVSGYVEVEFDRGARVFVEGPARVELLNDNHLKLTEGRLVAHVPPSATGFIVDTPTSRLVDIGTEFGVDCDAESGQTTVQVYQGEVKAAAAQGGEPIGTFISLLERDAVEIRSDRGLVPVTFQEQRYVRDYASLLITPVITGDTAWLSEPPATLKLNRAESPRAQVMLERRGVVLEEDLRIDFVPGAGWPFAGIAANKLAAGTRVDVYLVHLDAPGDKKFHAEGTIEFGRPILGGIGDGERLFDTDVLLGHPQIQYPIRGSQEYDVRARGIDLPEHDNDRVTINRSGTGISYSVDAGYRVDQFRVLVLAADDVAAQADD